MASVYIMFGYLEVSRRHLITYLGAVLGRPIVGRTTLL